MKIVQAFSLCFSTYAFNCQRAQLRMEEGEGLVLRLHAYMYMYVASAVRCVFVRFSFHSDCKCYKLALHTTRSWLMNTTISHHKDLAVKPLFTCVSEGCTLNTTGWVTPARQQCWRKETKQALVDMCCRYGHL